MTKIQRVILPLPQRIDASNADKLFEDLTTALYAKGDYDEVALDAEKLEYISSAGLRVLLRLKKNQAPNLHIIQVSREVYDIFEITGFDQLLDVEKKKRTVSVDGCEIIGKGYCGTVYRLDPETIIKVYRNASQDMLSDIENEKNMARLALVGGIPTAISYDIVKVGDSYGSVFELLNAVTFNDLVIQKPESIDEIIGQYVDFLKLVHKTEIDDPMFPSAKDKFLDYLATIKGCLNQELYTSLTQLIKGVKDSHHVVHGDPQMKNIMLSDGEPMLIDMDTLCAGEPIFDLQAIYVSYIAYSEDDPNNPMDFLGISFDMSRKIWNEVFTRYFEDRSPESKEAIFHKIQIIAYIRFLYLIVTSDSVDTELGRLRIKRATDHLSQLAGHYTDLNL